MRIELEIQMVDGETHFRRGRSKKGSHTVKQISIDTLVKSS